MSARWALFSGLLFGSGLVVSQMTLASKVYDFPDFAGNWDPTLGFVMVGAVIVHGVLRQPLARKQLPETAALAPPSGIDARLIYGTAAFGVGWGLFGYCPGPAIVSLGSFSREALIYVPAMIFGMWLHSLIERTLAGRRHKPEDRRRVTALTCGGNAAGDA